MAARIAGVYIQLRGIEQVRVRRGFEGRHRPVGVPFVALFDVGQIRPSVSSAPVLWHSAVAPAGPFLRRGGHKYLHLGLRRDHRPISRPSSTGPGAPCAANPALELDQRRPHLRRLPKPRRAASPIAGVLSAASLETARIERRAAAIAAA